MMWAIDFQKVDGRGRKYHGDSRKLKNWYSFGQPVYAIADGEVVFANGAAPDDPPGKSVGPSNGIAIRHDNDEWSQYGHLQQGSVTIQKGDRVKTGQMIGRVGNSGRAMIPHLHFGIYDTDHSTGGALAELDDPDGQMNRRLGGRAMSVPFYFDDFRLVKAGRTRCDIRVIHGRPQEGWIMEFNELKEETARQAR